MIRPDHYIMKKAVWLILAGALVAGGCSTKVTRMDVNEVRDLSGA